MTETRLWDRAAIVPVRSNGRRLPEIAALPENLPSVAELFDFMRDAELRFETLRLRIEERSQTARGEDVVAMDAVVRHPGEAKVTTTRATESVRPEYEAWISDGEIVRTYTTVSRQGGNLKLLSLTKRITDLLSITKLLTVFETYDNEADAVRSFASSANV